MTEKGGISRRTKLGTILSTVLWVIGFILLLIIKPDNPLVFLSDTFLLIGFWPLLFVWRAGWTWLVFGLLNICIGFFLELAKFLPTENMTPAMQAAYEQAKTHMISMHPALVWIFIGAASALFGLVRIGITIWRYLNSRNPKG